ncbi:hypothetical protein ACFY2M_44065 [Streptomyces sp. NPDC001276]|uniref:hypothetical protein n=1 Tax=Streptomyces sp. NPDC001276 TaxID=3364555 RepID=UPI003675CB2A
MPRVLEVTAKVGIRLRAEPIAQLYDQGLVHHVGTHVQLEDQMVTWAVGMDSPDRMDAALRGLTELADPDQLSASPDTSTTTASADADNPPETAP